MKPPIPAVWRIDVEPDEHRPKVQQKPWQGFLSIAALVEELREPLASRSGRAVHPTWFVRLDPDIERCFGQVDFVVRRHSELFDRMIGHKDPLSIHVHPHRWDEERSVAFSDHADDAWTTHCLTVVSDASTEGGNDSMSGIPGKGCMVGYERRFRSTGKTGAA